jgi:hypothetical protein
VLRSVDVHDHPGREVVAGITVAAVAVPGVIGYAHIAGMPIVTGLYTMIIPATVFVVLCSSRHLVVGADSTTAAILAAGLTPLARGRLRRVRRAGRDGGGPHRRDAAGGEAGRPGVHLRLPVSHPPDRLPRRCRGPGRGRPTPRRARRPGDRHGTGSDPRRPRRSPLRGRGGRRGSLRGVDRGDGGRGLAAATGPVAAAGRGGGDRRERHGGDRRGDDPRRHRRAPPPVVAPRPGTSTGSRRCCRSL